MTRPGRPRPARPGLRSRQKYTAQRALLAGI